MIITNTTELAELLNSQGYDQLSSMPSFEVDEAEYNSVLDEVRSQHPTLDDSHAQARAIYRILTHVQKSSTAHLESTPDAPSANTVIKAVDDLSRSLRQNIGVLAGKTAVVEQASQLAGNKIDVVLDVLSKSIDHSNSTIHQELEYTNEKLDKHYKRLAELTLASWRQRERQNKHIRWLIIGIGVILLGLLGLGIMHAAPTPIGPMPHPRVKPFVVVPMALPQVSGGSTLARMQFVSGGTWVNVSSSAPLPVTCISGCSGGGGGGGTSSNFGDPFPATGTAAGFINNSGNMAGGTLDSSGNLKVAQQGTVTVTGPLTDTQLRATAVPVSGPLTDTQLRATAVPVSLAAAPTTHVIVDSGNLTSNQNVAVAVALPAGSNVIGHVIADSGSTTAVTGNVTVVQPTASSLNVTAVGTGTFAAQVTGTVTANAGTNLNTSLLELDATGAALNLAQASTTSGQTGPLVQTATTTSAPSYTTAKTNPLSTDTSGNLRVAGAVTGSGNFTVVQPTGTNLHAVLDTTSTTAVTQSTAGNLNATVVGTGTFVVQNTNAAETTKVLGTVRNVGNVGGIFDTTQNAAVASNSLLQGCNFTSSPATITTANQGAVQCNSKGELLTQITDGTTNVAVISGTTALKTDMSSVAGTATVTAGVSGAQAVGGCVATNTATPCNPMNLGAQAVSSENSAATTAREVQLVADLVGKLIVLPYANPENFVNGTTAAITDTTSTSIIASAGGSLRNYVTSVIVTNSHATVGTFVKILEGTNIIWEGYAASLGGGFTTSFPVPLRGAAATAINCQPVTTGANVICSAAGYKGL